MRRCACAPCGIPPCGGGAHQEIVVPRAGHGVVERLYRVARRDRGALAPAVGRLWCSFGRWSVIWRRHRGGCLAGGRALNGSVRAAIGYSVGNASTAGVWVYVVGLRSVGGFFQQAAVVPRCQVLMKVVGAKPRAGQSSERTSPGWEAFHRHTPHHLATICVTSALRLRALNIP